MMGLRSLSLILVAGVAALPLSARAEDGDKPKPKAEASATVTVTAEATPVDLAKTPNPVKVITEEQIQRSGAKTLGELLSQALPGQVTTYGGPGTLSELYLGGSRASDVVVLLDGLRIADSLGLGANFANISLLGVERVEVLTGPASTRYGAEAHGGVVALYSNGSAAKGLSGSITGGLGTHGTRKAGFAPAYGWESGWVRGGIGAERTDASIRTDNPYRSFTTYLGVGQRLGESTLLTASYRNLFQGTPIPFNWDWMTNARQFQSDREELNRFEMMNGTLQTALGTSWSLEAAVGQTLSTRKYAVDGYRFTSRRNEAKVGAQGSWGESGVDFGAEGQEEFGWYGAPSDKIFGRHLALLAEGHWAPTPQVRLLLGGRQQWDRTGETGNPFNPIPEQAASQFVYKAGVNWLPSKAWRVYANLGTSYNAPNLYSVSWNWAHGAGSLDAEKSRSYLAGMSWSEGPWSARLDLNRINYSNMVAFIPNGAGFYVNEQDVRVQGAEVAGGYHAARWGLDLSARSQEGRNLSKPEDQQLRTFASRPFSAFGLQAFLIAGSVRMDLQASRIGPRYNYFSDLPGVDANRTHFTDVNVAATWTPTSPLSITFRGDHILQGTFTRAQWLAAEDQGRNDVAVLPGFISPGRTFTAELRYRF